MCTNGLQYNGARGLMDHGPAPLHFITFSSKLTNEPKKLEYYITLSWKGLLGETLSEVLLSVKTCQTFVGKAGAYPSEATYVTSM
jgi:hypothetical protein